MNAKVLVIGPNYYNFLPALASGYESLGCTVRCIGYDNPVDPYTWWMKVKYKFASPRVRSRMQQKSRDSFNVKVVAEFESFAPDMVFIMNGDIFSPDTLDFMRTRAKVAVWLFDNLSKMPSCRAILSHCDRLYSFDRRDVRSICESGVQAYFLPQACDTSLYYPKKDVVRDIDILFVGDLYYYPNRQALLRRVVEEFPDRRIKIVGNYKPWYKNPLKCLFREHRDIYLNHGIPSSEVNDYYNRSRVVLNIHRCDQKDGANPRVFEICGSGAYQICDSNPYIDSLFQKGEIGLYHSADELITRIREALQGDFSLQTEAAYREVVSRHSYQARSLEVISDLFGEVSFS